MPAPWYALGVEKDTWFMRKFLTPTLVCTLVVGTTACSSSKVLNESRARDLIREEIKRTNETYMVSISEIKPYLTRTRKDYTSTSAATGPEGIVKKLLEQKMVMQRVDSATYPKISGRFVYDNQYSSYEFDLNTMPNSNICAGKRTSVSKQMLGPNGRSVSDVTGNIEANGLVDLNGEKFQYTESGATATLRGQSGSVFNGPATGQKIEVKWYEYTFSPEMMKRIVHQQRGPFGVVTGDFVSGGDFVFGEVSDLQLVMETHAAAKIAWQVSLNDLGRLFLGAEKPAGKAEVQFVKKPDGTWIVVSDQ